MRGLAQQWRPRRTKSDTKVAREWRWCSNFEYTHSAEKARDTTLDDEKRRVLVTALDLQPVRNFRFRPWWLTTSHVMCYTNDKTIEKYRLARNSRFVSQLRKWVCGKLSPTLKGRGHTARPDSTQLKYSTSGAVSLGFLSVVKFWTCSELYDWQQTGDFCPIETRVELSFQSDHMARSYT